MLGDSPSLLWPRNRPWPQGSRVEGVDVRVSDARLEELRAQNLAAEEARAEQRAQPWAGREAVERRLTVPAPPAAIAAAEKLLTPPSSTKLGVMQARDLQKGGGPTLVAGDASPTTTSRAGNTASGAGAGFALERAGDRPLEAERTEEHDE